MKISGSLVKIPGMLRSQSGNVRKAAAGGGFFLSFGEKLSSRCQAELNRVLSNIVAVIFTTALSLSVSYLFFTQLAEHGW